MWKVFFFTGLRWKDCSFVLGFNEKSMKEEYLHSQHLIPFNKLVPHVNHWKQINQSVLTTYSRLHENTNLS